MAINFNKPTTVAKLKTTGAAGKYGEHLEAPAAPTTTPVDHLKSLGITGSIEGIKKNNLTGDTTPLMSEKISQPSDKIPLDKLCNLNVGGKMTINLGNYESAQIHCSLTVPCTKETLEDAYEYASAWVSDKIQSAVADAKKGVG